jgi:tRNA 5-methylaminomethyl-2-thiouridine biosynthesis bifunctional protein
MGSSYQPQVQAERSDHDNQANNYQHLQQLLPTLAKALAPEFLGNTLNTWKSTRCVTMDRLPAVGPLEASRQPGLWLCAGMGSRGLSFSMLCAELLAARLGAEPWPVESKLARSLDALRA